MGAKGWFCGPTRQSSSSNINAELTRNWVPETTPPTSKGRTSLLCRPGLGTPVTVGTGPHRAAHEQNGRTFVLSGTGYYERQSTGAYTKIGDVAYVNGEPGTIHGNGQGQSFVVSGGLGYIHTLATDDFTQIADPDFPTDVVMGFYINGHFGVIQRNSRVFAISAAFDGTDWHALDIAEKSKTTDYLIAAVVDRDASELWLIGTHSIEVWWYSGAPAFPLEPIPSNLVAHGGSAAWSWMPFGSSVIGLAESSEGLIVPMRFQAGYAPEPIGNHSLAATLQGYPRADIETARAFAFEWHGHRFYGLTVLNQTTHVFDEATGQWTEWTFLDAQTGAEEPFLGITHVYVGGTHYVGSRRDGALYPCSEAYLDDHGTPIRCLRRAAYLSDGPLRLLHNRLWFDIDTGVGLSTGQGSDPIGMVRWSDDGGRTWVDERRIRLGRQGEYRTRAELWRLGLAGPAGRVYELVVTDPVVRAIADADVDVLGEAA